MPKPTITLTVTLLERAHLDEECPDCGFDAMERYSFATAYADHLSVSSQTLCCRCRNEEQRAGL